MNSVRIGVDVAGIGRPLSTRAHRRCNSFQKAMCNTCDNRVEIHSTSEVLRDSGRVALKKSIGLCHVADGLSGANFKVHEFFSHLDGACKMGRCLLVGSALVSTQKLLSENARLFPEGTLLICDTQSNGKGRGNNLWTSNEGCLMFSFTCNFRDGRTLPCVQYIASLALVEAVKEYTAHVQGRVGEKEVLPGLKIKWPNDLYYGNQKIGGILCNSAYSDGAFCTTIGIGFNLHNKEPTLCLADVLEQHVAQSMKREVLVATFLGHFTRLNLTFSEAGFKSIRGEYTKHWLHTNQQVTIVENEEGALRRIEMTVKGLTETGLLLAEDSYGSKFELSPDGNGFDFFSGLIRRKLPRVY